MKNRQMVATIIVVFTLGMLIYLNITLTPRENRFLGLGYIYGLFYVSILNYLNNDK